MTLISKGLIVDNKIKVSKSQLAELESLTVAYMLAVDNEVGLSKDDVIKSVLLLDTRWGSMFTVSEGEKEATTQQQISDLEHKVAWFETFACKACGGAGSVGTPPDDYYDCPQCVQPLNKMERDLKLLREALSGMVKGYCDLVNSGDSGRWDPEKDKEVIESRKALAATNPDKE